jgi:hypothetical protein
LQFGAGRCHTRDQLIDVLCLGQVGTIPPKWQCLPVDPSRGVEIVQRVLIWFGQTKQAAAAVQQPRELARLTLDDQQPVVDGDVGRIALGQAECMRFGDNRCVPRMKRILARSPEADDLPADYGVCLSRLGHTGSSLRWGRARCATSCSCLCRPVKARPRRLAQVLTGWRTITAHARTVYRFMIGVTPVSPVQRRGGPDVLWRICAPYQWGFVSVKGAQRRRAAD